MPYLSVQINTNATKVPLHVNFFFRPLRDGFFSMEELFTNISQNLPSNVNYSKVTLPFPEPTFSHRLNNALCVKRKAGDINHITGDVNYIAFGLPQKRTILTIHDIDSFRQSSKVKNKIIKYGWLQWPASRVAAVTVISNSTKQQLINYINIDHNKIHVIPNPVATAFEFTEQKFNNTKPRILHLGTKENKNLERLIEAISGITCHLHIIGKLTGNQASLLKQHSILYTNAHNLEFSHIVEEYKKADVISFVSLYEGFGMPIIEAQATGRVVVTSNCSSMPEVGGDGALYVDPTDVNSIRSGIKKVIEHEGLRHKLIENGLENVKRFSAKEIAAKYAALYERVYQESQSSN